MLIPGYKKGSKSRKDDKLIQYSITYKDIASYFGYKNAQSFNSSKAKKAMIKGIVNIIYHIEQEIENNKSKIM